MLQYLSKKVYISKSFTINTIGLFQLSCIHFITFFGLTDATPHSTPRKFESLPWESMDIF